MIGRGARAPLDQSSSHGTFWLGDHQQEVGPGDLIIIRKDTAHAGSHATSGRFKAISIKSPPQAADDVHPVN